MEALRQDIRWGVWGGTTERERRLMQRRLDSGEVALADILKEI
jgi:hypothetical protein